MTINNLLVTDKLIRRFECKFMESDNGCWEWFSSNNWKGYGRFHIMYNGKSTLPHAHRVSYIIFKSPIPNKMTVHHKCHNRKCVNPDHLELKTNDENRLLGNCWSAVNAGKTNCINGHKLYGDNLYTYYRKYRDSYRIVRSCKTCKRITNKKRKK